MAYPHDEVKQGAMEIETVLPAASGHLQDNEKNGKTKLVTIIELFCAVHHANLKDFEREHAIFSGNDVECSVQPAACDPQYNLL